MRKILGEQNRALHALLHQLGLMDQKADLVDQASKGRTRSSKDMTWAEADYLIRILRAQKKERTSKQIGKIIHLLCLMGYVREDATPDYNRINKFVQNIGSRNPQRKTLHYLNIQELNAVVTQVEAMYKNEVKR